MSSFYNTQLIQNVDVQMRKYFDAMDRERKSWEDLNDKNHKDYQTIIDACFVKIR